MADSTQSATKICTKCASLKPLTGYHRDASSPDGRRTVCKECANAYGRGYMRAKYEADPDAERARARARYAADPEKASTRTRSWAKANAARAQGYTRAWQVRNPEKVQLANALRRARRRAATVGPVNPDLLWQRQCGLCAICAVVIDRNLRWPERQSPSLDHIVPLALGGTHEQSNLQWTHLVCNIRKGAKAP